MKTRCHKLPDCPFTGKESYTKSYSNIAVSRYRKRFGCGERYKCRMCKNYHITSGGGKLANLSKIIARLKKELLDLKRW